MAYPKVAKEQKRTGVGLSIEPEMLSQIDALSGGTGKRSTFIRELLVDGLEKRYGSDWRKVADSIGASRNSGTETKAA